MASKLFHLSLCIFFFTIVLPLQAYAETPDLKAKKPSPFEFIKHLQGCHRGEKVKDIHQLKSYLEHFGYLDYQHSQNHRHANDDDFDDLLEFAVKTYQLNYHLKATGILDSQTVSKMMTPRCGVPDVINGTNFMRADRKRHHHGPNAIHTVSHYNFFPGSPRWSQTHLTYGFLPGTNADAISAVARAFNKWADQTHFKFSRTQDYRNANIKISFNRNNPPFVGPGGYVAYAWAPTDGRFYYNADESWSVGSVAGSYDLETLALHEIGHLLGLDHSTVENAIMYPTFYHGVTKGLHGDDIQGIRALYNV